VTSDDDGVFATPRVPELHALLEYRDVLVVRHGALLKYRDDADAAEERASL
jgi:hypothetical protein